MSRALIIIAHGSSVNPGTAASVTEHVSILAQRPVVAGRFDEVRAVFLKQDPLLSEVDWSSWDEAVVVPFFMADGYFVRQILPKKLKVEAWSDYPAERSVDGCALTVVAPLGVRRELVDVVRAIHAGIDRDAHLLLVGHGTPAHVESTTSVREVAEVLAAELQGTVRVGFVDDEPPLSQSWSDEVHDGEAVVVVPYFAFRGPHVLEDIPGMLGLTDSSIGTYQVAGRTVHYAPVVGGADSIVDVLESMVTP